MGFEVVGVLVGSGRLFCVGRERAHDPRHHTPAAGTPPQCTSPVHVTVPCSESGSFAMHSRP